MTLAPITCKMAPRPLKDRLCIDTPALSLANEIPIFAVSCTCLHPPALAHALLHSHTVTFQPSAPLPHSAICAGAILDLENLQDTLEGPSEADIHYWTHGEESEDETTVHAILDALEKDGETWLYAGIDY